MSAALKEVAKETIAILERGEFIGACGTLVQFGVEQKQAEEGTKLYTPIDVDRLIYSTSGEEQQQASFCAIEVTDETTQVAAHRLVAVEGCQDLVLLNFASARNPCGGFLTGAKSQEEDLARCSGLYLCQLTQPTYYDVNRLGHYCARPQCPWRLETQRHGATRHCPDDASSSRIRSGNCSRQWSSLLASWSLGLWSLWQ
jgi:hypothetical protein